MSTNPVLSVSNLSVSFGSHEAVKSLSFDIKAGETLALVGESGSGKSATALSVMRLIEREGGAITGGTIRLGADVPVDITALGEADLQRLRGQRMSMVFQEPMTSLNPVINVGEQLAEVFRRHQKLSSSDALEASKSALQTVRIPEPARRLAQYPHELSGGLRQRVMIAMALACRPDLLIADEPSTALDVTTQANILQLIRELQAELGMAILFITHDMGVVAEIANRVLVLRDGRMIEEASVRELFTAPKAGYSRELMAATPKLGGGSPAAIPTSKTALRVDNLSVNFTVSQGLFSKKRQIPAVRGVSLEVNRGETLGLVGESGCGKSTLARSILHLIRPDSGRVEVDGEEWTGRSADELRPHRKAIQMVFQDPYASLNPRLTVRDLVTEPAYLHGLTASRDRRDKAVELLQKVGLEAESADRYPHQFSGGQRQRICIARALSVSPRIIIADEAVSALDVSIAHRITRLLQDLQEAEGVSILFISHDIAVVERVSHRIAVMYRGEIVETGLSAKVLTNPTHPYTRFLLSSVPVPDPARRFREHVGRGRDQVADIVAAAELSQIDEGHFARV